MPRTPHSLAQELSADFRLALNNRQWEILAGILAASEDIEATIRTLTANGREAILVAIEEEENKQCKRTT